MKKVIDMNWQGFFVVVGILLWTGTNLYEKAIHPEAKSWWTTMAPITIFGTMVVLLYLVAQLSIWMGKRSKRIDESSVEK